MRRFELSEEQVLLQRTARDFGRRRIKPLAKDLRSAAHHAPWERVEPLFREGAALGFTRLLIPAEHDGLGASCLDACIVMEELGAGDVAIAADYFSLTACIPLMLVRGGTEEQKARLLPAFVSERGFLAAGAQSEPNVGGGDIMAMSPDAGIGPRTLARRTDAGYLLSGQKSAFITNAGPARAYLIMARTDLSRPTAETLTAFWVPADAPGLTIGPPTDLIGWKASHHAPVYLNDTPVPDYNRIGAEGEAGMLFARLPEMGVCLAACFVGLARAAFDLALTYAQDRVSGGRRIIEHQAVALKLADMAVEVEQARWLVWRAAEACDVDWMQAATLAGPAAKTAAVDAAIRNAERAVQILGGYGVTTEYDAGALLSDAWVGYACDFTRDVLRLGMAPFLKPTV
jgi:alkylation response protein AidB-like acyl-CoA dehydrogenase